MDNHKINLEAYYKTQSYFIIYLELRFKKDKIKRSDILKGADIHQSAFSKAKRQNFEKQAILLEKLAAYYKLTPISKASLVKLETAINNLYMSALFMNSSQLMKSYASIQLIRPTFENSYLAILMKLCDLFYEVSLHESRFYPNTESYSKRWNELYFYYELLVPELKIILLLLGFMVCKVDGYSMDAWNVKLKELLAKHPFFLGDYYTKLAYAYYRKELYHASVFYYKESLSVMLDEMNIHRIELIQIHLLMNYYKMHLVNEGVELGFKLLRYLDMNEDKSSMYSDVYYYLSLFSFREAKYKEAEGYIEKAWLHENRIDLLALYMYIECVLYNYEKVRTLYNEHQWLLKQNNSKKELLKITQLNDYAMNYPNKRRNTKEWKAILVLFKEDML